MTVRERLWPRVKAAMMVQATTILLAVMAAFNLPPMTNFSVAVILVFSGLGVVLAMLYRTRCPACSYPIAMNGPVNPRAGAGAHSINYCPHSRININEDERVGSRPKPAPTPSAGGGNAPLKQLPPALSSPPRPPSPD